MLFRVDVLVSLWPSYVSLKFVNLKITFFLGSDLLDSYLTEAFYLLLFSVSMQLRLSFQPSLSRGVAKIIWLFLFWGIPGLRCHWAIWGHNNKTNVNRHDHQNNNSAEHCNVLSAVLKTSLPLTHFVLGFTEQELLFPPFYNGGNWGSDRLANLPKAIHVSKEMWVILFRKIIFLSLIYKNNACWWFKIKYWELW